MKPRILGLLLIGAMLIVRPPILSAQNVDAPRGAALKAAAEAARRSNTPARAPEVSTPANPVAGNPSGAPSNLERIGVVSRRPESPVSSTSRPTPQVGGRSLQNGPNATPQNAGGPQAPATLGAPFSLLYAPTENDDPAYRAAIAALTGGVVDYFDARAGTPTAAQLAAYDCVYTWANFAYANNVLMGDRLADYVDAGGNTILGMFCTYTSGFFLSGRIMTPGYSPVVSPAGSNHFALSAYAGNGTTSLHAGVLAYDCIFRDFLITQGGGIIDGTYADGEIAQAYRPDGRVIYTNGGGHIPLGGAGDWAQVIANAVMGAPIGPGMLYAPSNGDDPLYRAAISTFTGGPVNYFDAIAATPSAALLATYDCAYTWANFAYSDNVLFGDRLADFVDAGGKAILGVFCTYTSGFFLSGRIMTPDYSPVTSPAGNNHLSLSAYGGDGATPLHAGVAAYDGIFRDFLVAQGGGKVDGHYLDGEIAQAYRPDGRVVYSNGVGSPLGGGGQWPRLVANACMANLANGHRMLYAVSNPDDPAYRAVISTYTGGVVDYFDTRPATPSAALLATYDCVYTWTNAPHADPVLLGNRLADFVDAGGTVILGAFSTYTIGNSMGGRIMTPGYSPVTSPTGNNHFAVSAYVGNGTTCLHHGVTAYDCLIRDILVTQGNGLVDGRYADGEIAHAHRPDRRVIYSNGGGGSALLGAGQWPRLVANACDCGPLTGNLFASTQVGQMYTISPLTGAAFFAANLPTFAGGEGATEIEVNPANGRAWVQARDGQFFDQEFIIGSGLPVGGPVPNGASYAGLEFAVFGRLYGAAHNVACGASEFRILDPLTGGNTPIGPTGFGPLSGVAFHPRTSGLYALSSACAGPTNLYRIDITTGIASLIGPTGFRAGSLEFGPGGDLFAGGDVMDGGNIYRVNPTTGFSSLLGPSGQPAITGLAMAPLGTVAVEEETRTLLRVNAAPNPSVQGAVRVSFSVPSRGDAFLDLFDVAGRRVWSHEMQDLAPGDYSVGWEGRTSSGDRARAGVYLLKLTSPAGIRTATVVRLD